MRQQKIYEANDKMITLIKDNYNVLQSLGCFGISLGFGDKTVSQVCEEQQVDTTTFLAVVNYTINGERPDIASLNLLYRLSAALHTQRAQRRHRPHQQSRKAHHEALRPILPLHNLTHEV